MQQSSNTQTSGKSGMSNRDELAQQQQFQGQGMYPISNEDYDLESALAKHVREGHIGTGQHREGGL